MRIEDLMPTWFRETPEGQAMLDKERRQTTKMRQVVARELAAIEKQQETDLPPLKKAHDQAVAEAKKAQRAAREAEARVTDALHARLARSHVLDRRCNELKARLRESADPAIDVFIAELQERLEATRRESPVRLQYTEDAYGGNPRVVGSNRAEVDGYLESLRQAIADAEALKLEVGVDVMKRIDEIRSHVDEAAEKTAA